MASLRGSYNDPTSNSGWTFVPAPGSPESNLNTTTTIPDTAPVSGSAYQWSTRPSHNSIFDLSPSLSPSSDDFVAIDATLVFRSLVASALLQYASSAMAMPWEVGKMLLQVQWVPRNVDEPEEEVEQVAEDDDNFSDSSHDDEAYFADPSNPSRRVPPRPADEQGYIIRHSILEEGTRPEYIIPVGSANGVWEMIKCLGRFRAEGWFALWKGLLTSCISDVISTTMQPIIHNVLLSVFHSSLGSSSFDQPPLLLPLASHVITGFILSPLDLIRTRLIVQSFLPRYRSYSGPVDALSQILRDEGGLSGIYLHPHLLIPTLLDNTLRPLVSAILPQLILSSSNTRLISPSSNPIAFNALEMAAGCAGLLITLPFETVRRRLQVQARGNAKPIKGCVELRPVPYNGVVDTFWHILTEERSDLPVRRMTRRREGKGKGRAESGTSGADKDSEINANQTDEGGWLRHTGVGQLYRGFGMRLGASAIVFVLAFFTAGEDVDGGWAEL
ncbi:hypothetical protein EYR36_007116 [Pleurotus pulmonarius]|nr:hypothetical protein EYR36_007116 [Pleurotus pulmonarius]